MKNPNITVEVSNIDKLKKRLSEKEAALKITERNLEIGAALERVRSLTMVMKRSEDLSKIILTVYKELRQLDIALTRTLIWLFSENPDTFEVWVADIEADDRTFVMKQEVEHPYHKRMFEAWKKRKSKWVYINEGEGKKDLDDYLFTQTAAAAVPEEVKAGIRAVEKIVNSFSFHNFGCLQADGAEELSDDNFEILYRFAKEFDLAYTRYLDLKKAEIQAREAQIETALERIRSRTMAMHKSEEIADIVGKIFEELGNLDIVLTRVLIWIFNKEERYVDWWSANSELNNTAESYRLDFNQNPVFLAYLKAWEKKLPLFKYTLSGDVKISWEDYIFNNTGLAKMPVEVQDGMRGEGTIHTMSAISSYGLMMAGSLEPLSDENTDIIQRFGRVFQQSYTRYLDVQKAEAQVREAEIQLALERVRARTMAMQHSDELSDTSFLLAQQVRELGIKAWGCAFHVYAEDKDGDYEWFSNEEGYLPFYKTPREKIFKQYYEKRENGETLYMKEFKGKACAKHYEYLMTLPIVGEALKELKDKGISFPTSQIDHVAYFKFGYLLFITYEHVPQAYEIFKRFAKEFEQTYTRFLDLKKAEAQAREAEIEVALERVRSRGMAMHKSDELAEVATILYGELVKLGIRDFLNCGFVEVDEEQKAQHGWSTLPDGSKAEGYYLPITGDIVLKKRYEAWKKKIPAFHQSVGGKGLKKHMEFVFKTMGSEEVIEMTQQSFPDPTIFYCFNFSHGYLHIITDKLLEAKDELILIRFSKAFEQTYTRFQDLKKAEDQAREAQIEAALERVRASSMAMYKSDDLNNVLSTMFNELTSLDFELARCVIWIYNTEDKSIRWYAANPEAEIESYHIPYYDYKVLNDYWDAWEKRIPRMYYDLSGDLKKGMDEYIFKHTEMSNMPKEVIRGMVDPEQVHIYNTFNDFGALLVPTHEPQEEEIYSILERFGNVFNQSYTRFKDILKAEAQAREAQIEASLERVRAKAMAMQKSEDLSESVAITLNELENLELTFQRCGIGIIDDNTKKAQLYTTTRVDDGNKMIVEGDLLLTDHPMLSGTLKAWHKQERYSYILEGKDLRNYYKLISNSSFPLPEDSLKAALLMKRQYAYYLMFPAGALYFFSVKALSDTDIQILQRFTDVFHLAYTRFEDLQNAEARAIEAERQASLDRVRGVIASMRSKEDLNRITPLIWEELKALNVPFIRCGVFIMDETKEIIRSYLSTPDGRTLGIFDLPFTSELIGELMVNSWQQGKIYKDHWSKAQFVEFMQRLKKTGQITDPGSYQGAAAPPEQLNLHFIPFRQGMLYVGNLDPLTKDELLLVKSLAEAFSIAYSRYEDFKELELAKNKIEATLNELKSAQSQLIHAEKMASLGELTAGIAHEIQNPLNFVNNFSDVSIDLIEELKEERNKKGAERDELIEKELLDDVIQNLEKINHHGLRASSIVKGMLEHSRTGSKEKQLIDLNALSDEYLRLAYHGLRAKDKSFNADFSLEKDDSLPKVKIIPQDIGRVLLNLINNAFYAVSSKVKEGIKDFRPQVIVSIQAVRTGAEETAAVIKVKDNGNGIPKKIVDKIFQPFFTTKPTGQGTGLGLSLSYDIIKAHGGEITVESTEGVGTEFKIVLRLNTN